MKAGAIAFLLLAGAAQAQTAKPPPVESVTVTGLKDVPQEVVNRFVRAFAAPSYLTGKMARWENGVCPVTAGIAPKFAAFISARVRTLAAEVGAPVDRRAACRANIEIAFTTRPQDLLDIVRKDHRNYLGYASGPSHAKRLAVVKYPIQAWYMTATTDVDGKVDVDTFNTAPLEPVRVPCFSCSLGYMELYVPGGAKRVSGSRIRDELRTILQHVIITADPTTLKDYEMGALADYIGMLALTQLNSLEVCQQPLPSIVNLLAKDCPNPPNRLSESDLGYLKGLYSMSADGNMRMQQDGIAYQMKQTLNGK